MTNSTDAEIFKDCVNFTQIAAENRKIMDLSDEIFIKIKTSWQGILCIKVKIFKSQFT